MIGKSILENLEKWTQTSEFYLAQITSLSFVLRSGHNNTTNITIKQPNFIYSKHNFTFTFMGSTILVKILLQLIALDSLMKRKVIGS